MDPILCARVLCAARPLFHRLADVCPVLRQVARCRHESAYMVRGTRCSPPRAMETRSWPQSSLPRCPLLSRPLRTRMCVHGHGARCRLTSACARGADRKAPATLHVCVAPVASETALLVRVVRCSSTSAWVRGPNRQAICHAARCCPTRCLPEGAFMVRGARCSPTSAWERGAACPSRLPPTLFPIPRFPLHSWRPARPRSSTLVCGTHSPKEWVRG